MDDFIKIIILVIGAYLLGNVNTAVIISKVLKEDIREMGSGNAGTMNMVRNFGTKAGIFTLIIDALKGALPCVLGWYFIGETMSFQGTRLGAHIGAFSIVVGNIFPVFLRFKGGKGIATTVGACFVVQPLVAAIAFVAGIIFLFVVSIGSLTSFIVTSVPIAAEIIRLRTDTTAFGIAGAILMAGIFALIIFAHRKNIVRLFKGIEPRTVLFRKKPHDEEEADS